MKHPDAAAATPATMAPGGESRVSRDEGEGAAARTKVQTTSLHAKEGMGEVAQPSDAHRHFALELWLSVATQLWPSRAHRTEAQRDAAVIHIATWLAGFRKLDPDRIRAEFHARCALTLRYVQRDPSIRFVADPHWYFNPSNPHGFRGTREWLEAEQKLKRHKQDRARTAEQIKFHLVENYMADPSPAMIGMIGVALAKYPFAAEAQQLVQVLAKLYHELPEDLWRGRLERSIKGFRKRAYKVAPPIYQASRNQVQAEADARAAKANQRAAAHRVHVRRTGEAPLHIRDLVSTLFSAR